jgi:hypothetical protein
MRKLTMVIGLVLIMTLGLAAIEGRSQPARAATGDNLVLVWNDETLEAIRKLPPAPTVAARALAIVHTAIYDAWAAYDPLAVGTRLGAGLRQPEAERTQANKNKAVSYAAYTALMDLFPAPARQAVFTARMQSLYGEAFATDTSAPATVGFTAAQAVLDFRHTDGSNQANGYADTSGYVPVNSWDQVREPDHWQPLCVPLPAPGATSCPAQQRFATPHWRIVTPFALTSAAQFRPDHGPAVTVLKGKPSDAYRKEVDQQLRYSAGLTDTHKVIAEYWEDPPGSETPAGHWNLFAQWVSRRDHHSLDEDAKVFFALNNALLDASITAWDAKREWNSVRPITAVRWLKKGQLVQAWGGPFQGTKTIRGEDWVPYQRATFVTPSFPEYLSGALHLQRRRGHAAQGGHRQRHLRDVGHHRGRQLAHRAGRGPGCPGDPVLEVVHRGRRPGRDLPGVRWDPLQRRRLRGPPGWRGRRPPGLVQGQELLQRQSHPQDLTDPHHDEGPANREACSPPRGVERPRRAARPSPLWSLGRASVSDRPPT